MTTYTAPTQDMLFVINELAGLEEVSRLAGFEDASADMAEAILQEAGNFSKEVLAPINGIGDRQGSRLVDGKVVVPEGFTEAYRQYVENGWPGLGQDVEFGGQGLPSLVSTAVSEMWNASNLALSLCPLLTTGAIEALHSHASDALKSVYLPELVSGNWTATMNLTEPQAGSDLGAIRCRAEPAGDHYLLSGQKIFITWGDHEMSENVIHLVLARLPDAAADARGISLFLVPKFLVNEDGSLDERNDVYAVSLEHKMGVHASPTCVMNFGDEGGAIGYLVGEPGKGLAGMFTMMNHARIGCGLQGIGIAERAYQQAVEFARDRVQGYAPGHRGRVTIIHHADVRRMLMLMRAHTEAMRCVAYIAAAALDKSHRDETADQRASNQALVDLLTPVVKGWCTEVAQEITTLGVQIHGGMGFIEETGVSQHFRDARITTIYEGTTGIQAADLVGRKILRDGGTAMRSLLGEMQAFAARFVDDGDELVSRMAQRVAKGGRQLAEATERLIDQAVSDPNYSGAVSVNFLMLTGTVLGGWQMSRAAVVARKKLDTGTSAARFCQSKIVFARFYAEQIMPRADAYLEAVLAGGDNIMELPQELL